MESFGTCASTLAFVSFGFALMNNLICDFSGPLKKECNKTANYAVPCGLLCSMVACFLTMMPFMYGGGIGGIGRGR
jgi:dolichyl-phosphate-mannose--protein O-mannosyl transferase